MKNKNGKILRVDLSSMSFSEEDSGRYNERFLGGRGVGAWILFNELDRETNPLDSNSIIIFSA